MATRIQTDCHLVQEGTSEKVALIVQYLATFITGFVLAFVRGPLLALALSSILIVIVGIGIFMRSFMAKSIATSLEAVAKAGTLAEEAVGSVRTVQAFGTTATLRKNFDVFMALMKKAGRRSTIGEASGISMMCKL